MGIYIALPSDPTKLPEKKKDGTPIVSEIELIKVKELGEGASFGELALLNNKPRLATIKCLAKTYLATLSKDNFNRILKEHEESKFREGKQLARSINTPSNFCAQRWISSRLCRSSAT